MRCTHEQVARAWYAAVRQLAQDDGSPRRPVWDLLPAAERAWLVLCAARTRMGWLPEQVQESLRRDLLADGWRPGAVIDHCEKTHPALVPWNDMGVKWQTQFRLLQMTAVALTLDVLPTWAWMDCVTAPLSGI
jgi:hypothetical protein